MVLVRLENIDLMV